MSDTNVKIFADIFEATVAAIFLEKGAFVMADKSVYKMLKPPFMNQSSLLSEHPRVYVEKIFKAKTYTNQIHLAYDM